jgi:hypothetical protein
MKIIKVNNLDELDQLKIGDVIQSCNSEKVDNLIYKGRTDNLMGFIEIPKLVNPKIIFGRIYFQEKIKFVNGMITSSIYLPTFYRANNEKNKFTFDLIKGVLN